MFDWTLFTLLLYIIMRMTGFVIFSPVFGRRGIPVWGQLGFALSLAALVYSTTRQTPAVPVTVLEFSLHALLELSVGMALSMIMRFFFYIADQAGEILDSQMGLSMGKNYDPGSQSNMTNTGNMLNTLMLLLFFAEGGHYTLLRMMLTSGEIIPYGSVRPGSELAERAVLLFAECALLAVKLALPILSAELMGQVGMGILMKVNPQLNVFALNIEVKILIGLSMLLLLLSPMTRFLLEAETEMLKALRLMLGLMAP